MFFFIIPLAPILGILPHLLMQLTFPRHHTLRNPSVLTPTPSADYSSISSDLCSMYELFFFLFFISATTKLGNSPKFEFY